MLETQTVCGIFYIKTYNIGRKAPYISL